MTQPAEDQSGPAPRRLEHLWAGWRLSYIESVSDDAPPPDRPPNDCVFCGIFTSGMDDLDTHVVAHSPEGDITAILNAYPYASGHVLVMPNRHVGEIEDLEESEHAHLWSEVHRAVAATKAAYHPDGLNVGVNLGRAAGAGVPGHLHVHVLPRWGGDSNFMTSVAEARVMPEPLSASAAKLRQAWPD